MVVPAAQPILPTPRRKLDGKFQHRSEALGSLPASPRVSASNLIPPGPYVKSYNFKLFERLRETLYHRFCFLRSPCPWTQPDTKPEIPVGSHCKR